VGASKWIPEFPTRTPIWRHVVLVLLVVGSLVWVLSLAPIAQDAGYHAFADKRMFLGIPNFFDVVTNLPFLLVGVLGLRVCLQAKPESVRSAWMVLFAGVGLVSVGSAYYHWNPGNEALVWDRLPMTIGFMGLLVALLGEYIGNRPAALLLIPAVGLGLASVVYWHFTDDLRPYLWVQLVPLLTIPAVMVLYRNAYSHQWLLLVALGWYLLAKLTEFYDLAVFQYMQELISGHSIKHLLAGAGCYSILLMLRKRKAIE
jgi:hypothetical protein